MSRLPCGGVAARSWAKKALITNLPVSWAVIWKKSSLVTPAAVSWIVRSLIVIFCSEPSTVAAPMLSLGSRRSGSVNSTSCVFRISISSKLTAVTAGLDVKENVPESGSGPG